MTTPVGPVHGDKRAETVMGTLLRCVCDTLAAGDRAVCCCQWRRSSETTMPLLCDATCGQAQGTAWVRLVERRFNQQQRQRAFDGGVCSWSEVWMVEAGVARCLPDGACEGCQEATDTAADGAWDEHLLIKALTCCEDLRPYGVEPQTVFTLGPDGDSGGCIAAVMRASLRPR